MESTGHEVGAIAGNDAQKFELACLINLIHSLLSWAVGNTSNELIGVFDPSTCTEVDELLTPSLLINWIGVEKLHDTNSLRDQESEPTFNSYSHE